MRRLVAGVVVAFFALPSFALAGGGEDPMRARQWNLDLVKADAAHARATGKGAVVAVIDSGVDVDHPDLQGALLEGRDFVDAGTPEDGNGHGTHVSGVVAARKGNGVGVSSVAPGAQVLPVRVLDEDGGGSSGDVADGVDYAVDRGADVIGLSLSAEIPLPALGFGGAISDAVERAISRGVVVVMASGNSGLPLCEQDTRGGRVICVGAVDRMANRSSFSSFGSGLSLVAPGGAGTGEPGEDVLSTYKDGGYEEIAGTSMAVPHVAGVAALLVELGLEGPEVGPRLTATARDLGPSGRDGSYGAGLVDAQAAVAGLSEPSATPAADPPASSPAPPRRASIRLARRARISTLLRSGLRVDCRAPESGRCTGMLVRSGTRLASARTSGADETGFRLVPTRRGRAILRRALRRGTRRLSSSVRITAPGSPNIARRVILVG